MHAAAPTRHPTEIAMGLMVLAMVLVPAIDAIAKFLTDTLAPGQIAWARFFFQMFFLLPLALHGERLVHLADTPWHLLRGVLIAAATTCFFAALTVMPLADNIAIFFVEPLILSLLAGVLLKEGIGWRRIAAILVGFAGAMLIVRPSFAAFGVYALLPLLAGTCFAFYLLLTRLLAARTDAIMMQVSAGVGGLATMTALMGLGAVTDWPLMAWHAPDAAGWGLLVLLGLVATVAHLLIVQAFRRASAVILAPFQYLEIMAAVFWGWLVFGDWPEPMTWLGIAIIVAAGLYVFHRERRRAVDRVEEAEPAR
ncbi:MAG: DMT family transporter [Alphaproteobacteria bacterium]